jgi:cell division protein FtsB
MTKETDLGLSSTSKASTHQQNREFEQLKAENNKIRQENKKILESLLKGS